MTSGKRIQRHNRDEWPVDDAFDYVVDLHDIAPFSTFPSPAHWNDPDTKGPGTDTWPMNMVNGFGADTHWRMVFSIHLMRGDPTRWSIDLPRRERVRAIRIAPNMIYHRNKVYEITFDGDASTTRRFEVDPDEDVHVLEFEKPVAANVVEVNIAEWRESGRADVIGIDTLEILVERPKGFDERVRPLLNIGGLVAYPRGEGGVLLNQYRFREMESNPVNFEKKKTVLATLLRNLGAPFGGGGTAVAGFNLEYAPVSLEDDANLYLTTGQGWPDKTGDLSGLPKGENTFTGVRYSIRDFSTSPLESAVTLKHGRFGSNADGEAVRGMQVGRKADSLFFLHTFLEQRAWKESRRDTDPPVVFAYTVHYADGSEETVEVVYGRGVAAWRQPEPTSLAEAELAWVGALDGDHRAAVYQMQWNNPHPDREIVSVDLTYGPENGKRWGAPVLLGITAAKVIEN